METQATESGPANLSDQIAKEQLEVHKLQLEILHLSKPMWKQLAFWTAFLSLAVILTGAFISWKSGWFDEKQLEIKNANLLMQAQNEKLMITKDQLTAETVELNTKRAALDADIERLKAGKIEGQGDLVVLTNQLKQLERERDEKEDVIRTLSARISDVSKENNQMQQLVSKFNDIESARDKAENQVIELRDRLALTDERARKVIYDAGDALDVFAGVLISTEKFQQSAMKESLLMADIGKWRAGCDDDIARFKLKAFTASVETNAPASAKVNTP